MQAFRCSRQATLRENGTDKTIAVGMCRAERASTPTTCTRPPTLQVHATCPSGSDGTAAKRAFHRLATALMVIAGSRSRRCSRPKLFTPQNASNIHTRCHIARDHRSMLVHISRITRSSDFQVQRYVHHPLYRMVTRQRHPSPVCFAQQLLRPWIP